MRPREFRYHCCELCEKEREDEGECGGEDGGERAGDDRDGGEDGEDDEPEDRVFPEQSVDPNARSRHQRRHEKLLPVQARFNSELVEPGTFHTSKGLWDEQLRNQAMNRTESYSSSLDCHHGYGHYLSMYQTEQRIVACDIIPSLLATALRSLPRLRAVVRTASLRLAC